MMTLKFNTPHGGAKKNGSKFLILPVLQMFCNPSLTECTLCKQKNKVQTLWSESSHQKSKWIQFKFRIRSYSVYSIFSNNAKNFLKDKKTIVLTGIRGLDTNSQTDTRVFTS
jgi:hypothetical protein